MSELVARLREALEGVELASASDLARRWGVSRQAVSLNVKSRDFPAPVFTSDTVTLYAVVEADDWRRKRDEDPVTQARRAGAARSRSRIAR